MRTQTIVILEVDEDGRIDRMYTNDPDLIIKRVGPNERERRMVECGSCDHYHPFYFGGDCRDDNNRYVTLDF